MRIGRLALVLGGVLCQLRAQTARDQARLQDLSFVTTQLPKLHANFFFQLDQAAFAQAASTLQTQVPTLSDAQFYVGLAQLAAMAGDAHTFLNLNDSAAASAGFQTFPLNFFWMDDGVFVTGAAPEYAQALGARLVRVGDTPIDQVVRLLGAVIPSENPQWLHYRVQDYLRGQQILQGLGVPPQDATSPLTFQNLAGNEFTLRVSPGAESIKFAPSPSQGPESLYIAGNASLLNSGQSYSFNYVSALHLLYVRYLHCQNDPGNPFSSFAAAVLQTLDANPVDTFVLDLRDNTGGDDSVINPLVNGLTQRASALVSHPNFRFYEIINKGTFSSGMDDAMAIKSLVLQTEAQYPGLGIGARFLVIGEPTGGKPSHYGTTAGFALPASHLTGQYSTRFISAPSGIPNGPSFNPDISVGTRSTDFFARFDPVMGAIVARSTGAVAPPSGAAIVVNGASFRMEQGLAPGSFASAFGNFGQTPDQVLIAGASGQIISAGAGQVNFIVPTSLAIGPASASVRAGGVELATGQVTITSSSPGVFILPPTDPSQPGAVENQDFSVNGQANPAAAGSVIQIFATGYRLLDGSGAAPVNVYIADAPAQVLFSGPIAPGLWQINAQVPPMLSGQASLYLVSGNTASNAVTVWLR